MVKTKKEEEETGGIETTPAPKIETKTNASEFHLKKKQTGRE